MTRAKGIASRQEPVGDLPVAPSGPAPGATSEGALTDADRLAMVAAISDLDFYRTGTNWDWQLTVVLRDVLRIITTTRASDDG